METIKRRLKVTIEQEVEIEIMPSMFFGETEEEYLKQFNEGLWPVDSLDDVIKYAAQTAVVDGGGNEHDGLGRVEAAHMKGTVDASVYFDELSYEIESEFI